MMKIKYAAGLLMYRERDGKREVFLVHPGGPFWKKRDDGVWSFPKGEVNENEDLMAAAVREFQEETGFVPEGPFMPLGTAMNPTKILYVWSFAGDVDPTKLVSNTCEISWPPKTGKRMSIPEIDRGEYFTVDVARTKLNGYQVAILDAFEKIA